ncbi:MAG: hypothetical protein AAFO73_10345 [Pseudomonadota bacterium]
MNKYWPLSFEEYSRLSDDERMIAAIECAGADLQSRMHRTLVSNDDAVPSAEPILEVGSAVHHPVQGPSTVAAISVMLGERHPEPVLVIRSDSNGEVRTAPLTELFAEGMRFQSDVSAG